MRKIASYMIALILANTVTIAAFAQSTTISGNIVNGVTNESVSAVSVIIKGAPVGTFTDDTGNFNISLNQKLPVTLLISSVGFPLQEVVIKSSQPVNLKMEPSNSVGQEVSVAATRVAQKILESPVSIERISAAGIRSAPSANFYDVVTTLKGVDVTTSSLTFKTPTTRGFNSSGNTRFNQLVEGMANQAPGLNFSVT